MKYRIAKITGIIDHGVNSSEISYGKIDNFMGRIPISNTGIRANCLTAKRFDLGHNLICRALTIA